MRGRARRSLLDAPAEELAAHVELTARAQDLTDRLPLEARPVDRPFARDDEIRSGRLRPEGDALEDDARARDELQRWFEQLPAFASASRLARRNADDQHGKKD